MSIIKKILHGILYILEPDPPAQKLSALQHPPYSSWGLSAFFFQLHGTVILDGILEIDAQGKRNL